MLPLREGLTMKSFCLDYPWLLVYTFKFDINAQKTMVLNNNLYLLSNTGDFSGISMLNFRGVTVVSPTTNISSNIFEAKQIMTMKLWSMEEILHQLRLVVYPIVYRVFYMPGGWEWDFFTINSIDDILMYIHLPLVRNTFLNIDWCTMWPASFNNNNLRLGDVGIQATDDERKILSASAVVNQGHLAPWVKCPRLGREDVP